VRLSRDSLLCRDSPDGASLLQHYLHLELGRDGDHEIAPHSGLGRQGGPEPLHDEVVAQRGDRGFLWMDEVVE
jgi:hypothetical protein